jgi:transcriptional regulator with XRE-family HTH domain
MTMGEVERASTETMPISQALRDTIRQRGLTAYAAAKRAGVSVDAVQRFLNGQRGLTLATADKLAAALCLVVRPHAPPADQRQPTAPPRPRHPDGESACEG